MAAADWHRNLKTLNFFLYILTIVQEAQHLKKKNVKNPGVVSFFCPCSASFILEPLLQQRKIKSCWNFYLADEYTYVFYTSPHHSQARMFIREHTHTHTDTRTNSQMCRCERWEPKAIKTGQNPAGRLFFLSGLFFIIPLRSATFYVFYSLHVHVHVHCRRVVPAVPGLLLSVCRVHFLSKHGQSFWEPWSFTDKITDKSPALFKERVK